MKDFHVSKDEQDIIDQVFDLVLPLGKRAMAIILLILFYVLTSEE
jgi:hypothetical protein